MKVSYYNGIFYYARHLNQARIEFSSVFLHVIMEYFAQPG